VVQQLVKHASPKLVKWIRFPVGPQYHLKKLSSLVFGVNGWVRGNSSRAVLPLAQHSLQKPTASASGNGCLRPHVALRTEYKMRVLINIEIGGKTAAATDISNEETVKFITKLSIFWRI